MEQIQVLVDNKVIEIYLAFIEEFKDAKTLMNILEGLFILLKKGDNIKGKEENPFLKIFEDNMGVKKLELIQKHPSKGVFRKVTEILEHFFEYQVEA